MIRGHPGLFVRIPKTACLLDFFSQLDLAKANLNLDPAICRKYNTRNPVMLINYDFNGFDPFLPDLIIAVPDTNKLIPILF